MATKKTMTRKKLSKSSQRWLNEHHTDPYVKRAKQEERRSRSVYKLMEIQEKDKLIKPGMTVVDIGAAPGGWSEFAASCVKKSGRVIALDILPIAPFQSTTKNANHGDIDRLQGDFNKPDTINALLSLIGDTPVDIVLSDIAPNASGIRQVDQLKALQLAELALDFAINVLRPNGCFLVKIFQGEGFDDYLKQARPLFTKVVMRKPKASRPRSREVYLLGLGLRVNPEKND